MRQGVEKYVKFSPIFGQSWMGEIFLFSTTVKMVRMVDLKGPHALMMAELKRHCKEDVWVSTFSFNIFVYDV